MVKYRYMNRLRAFLRNRLMSFVDIPSIEEFSVKDQKAIDDWLEISVGHKGFHLYLKARDRAFVQSMVGLPIASESQRCQYYQYAGARMENARLLQRANAVSKKP